MSSQAAVIHPVDHQLTLTEKYWNDFSIQLVKTNGKMQGVQEVMTGAMADRGECMRNNFSSRCRMAYWKGRLDRYE
jgi:hypothetical protein